MRSTARTREARAVELENEWVREDEGRRTVLENGRERQREGMRGVRSPVELEEVVVQSDKAAQVGRLAYESFTGQTASQATEVVGFEEHLS